MYLLSVLAGCQPNTGNSASRADSAEMTQDSLGQELLADKTFILDRQLDEISGHTFLAVKPELLYAVQDELGAVFTYNLNDGTTESAYKFAGSGDYEDITTDGTNFYVLRSDGTIFSFPTSLDAPKDQVVTTKGLLGKGEYESMAYDPTSKNIYVLCKECKQDKGNPAVSGYILNIGTNGTLTLQKEFKLDLIKVGELAGKTMKSMRPSAITKRGNNQWFVLSAVDNLLIILNEEWVPQRVIRFGKKQFEQPEGIAFDAQDRLFISSEKNKGENAVVYQFNTIR